MSCTSVLFQSDVNGMVREQLTEGQGQHDKSHT